jgi:hypothetical protein
LFIITTQMFGLVKLDLSEYLKVGDLYHVMILYARMKGFTWLNINQLKLANVVLVDIKLILG